MSDSTPYAQLKERGASPVEVWRQAEADGLDSITRIRLVRELFGLTLVEAKAVSIEARSGSSLEQHQAELVAGLEDALKSED